MRLRRDLVGLFNHRDIGGRMVLVDAGDQLFVEDIRTGEILHCLHILVVPVHFHISVFYTDFRLCHNQHLPFCNYNCSVPSQLQFMQNP